MNSVQKLFDKSKGQISATQVYVRNNSLLVFDALQSEHYSNEEQH